jgi:MFS superfamily sulfate permease-like transporter
MEHSVARHRKPYGNQVLTVWTSVVLAVIVVGAILVIVWVVRLGGTGSYYDAISGWATLVAACTAGVAAIVAVKGLQFENERAREESRLQRLSLSAELILSLEDSYNTTEMREARRESGQIVAR